MPWIGMTVKADPAPKPRRGQAGREPAQIRKPFKSVADASPVDRPRANAADRRSHVEHRQRAGDGIHHPGDANETTAKEDYNLRSVAVNKPAFDRHQPRFRQHKDAERDLYGRS